MFKKITAAILCLALAAICAGCGDKKDDSSSKAESSATEAVTEEITEAPTEAATEAPTEASTEVPTEAEIQSEEISDMSTEEVTKILTSGKWKSGYITDAQGMIYNITDYCEAISVDPSAFDMHMEFSDDGTVTLGSAAEGEEDGKYEVDGISVNLIDETDNTEIALFYDNENEMLFMDLLGSGEMLIGFTVE